MRSRRTGKEALHTRVVQDKRRKNDKNPAHHERCTSCGSNACYGWCHPDDLDYDYALLYLRLCPGVISVKEISGSELIVYVKEHGDVDRQKLLDFEETWDVEVKVHATQGRPIERSWY